jgi:hypothetical protein
MTIYDLRRLPLTGVGAFIIWHPALGMETQFSDRKFCKRFIPRSVAMDSG